MRGVAEILVFGADADSLNQAADLLCRIGYEVHRCASAKGAMLRLRQSRVDIALLDVNTNEILGTEIIKEARAHNPEVSIILMGAKEDIDANPNLLLFGGYEYVLKPLSSEALRTAIEQRLNQQRIYRICSTLGSTLNLDETLDLILETAMRETEADHGAILLESGSRGMFKVEATSGLPGEIVGTEHAFENTPILRLVLDNCEPVVIQGGFARLGFLPDPVSSAISSSVCAPIRINGKPVGALNVNRAAPAEPFSQSDLRMIEIIGMQAAVALTNARAHLQALERQKLDHELDLARSIQQSLLPLTPFRRQWIDVEPRSMPARVIGGDFYDLVELGPDRFGLAIGDVAGKGIPGALLMVRAISSLRLRVGPDISPGAVFRMLNRDLVLNGSRGMYVTAIYAVFDLRRQTLQFACAGHPDPILRRGGSGARSPVRSSGAIPLGIVEDAEFETIEVEFRPGDLAVFYTDGVTEARNLSSEEFTLERLESLIAKRAPSAKQVVDGIMSELASFTAGRPRHDDLTLVAVGSRRQ
jgi:sigma-B regulation protein RsbU (phosphoserine phosphatase)